MAFSYYGLGALFLAFAVLPAQRALASLRASAEPTDLAAQRTIHHFSRSFLWLAQALRLVRVRVRGAERLRRPALVVANHPSLLDTPVLTGVMPQADFIVAPSWSASPFFRRTSAAAGYLDAEPGPAAVREAAARVRAGRSVVVYPEGSRTPLEGLGEFRRGAAHIALRAGCDLVPVVIRVSPRTLMKGQPWTDVGEGAAQWDVEVGEPIRPTDHLDGTESRPVAARRVTAVLREYFEKRMHRGSC